MKKINTGFERLRKAITLSAVGTAGLLGMGSGRAATTNTAVTIRVSNVISNGTSVVLTAINDTTVGRGNVLLSTAVVSHNSTSDAFGISEAEIKGLSQAWSGQNYNGVFDSGSFTASNTFNCNTSTSVSPAGSSSNSIPSCRGTSSLGLTDAFDGYGGIFVDGAPYNDTDGTVDLTGTTLTTDADTMPNGLDVSSQYHLFTDKRLTRIIHKITNPTGLTVNTRVAIGGNLGSDGGTYVPNTSNGNQLIESGDTWVITHDQFVFGGVAARDPILTHVVGATGGVTAIPLQIPGPSNTPVKSNKAGNVSIQGGGPSFSDNISFGYDLSIPAGETQYVTWFVQKSASMTETNASLPDFTDTTSATAAGLFINLPVGMTGAGVNWPVVIAGPAPAAAQPIPVFSPISLMLLTGVFGFAASRRIRKVK